MYVKLWCGEVSARPTNLKSWAFVHVFLDSLFFVEVRRRVRWGAYSIRGSVRMSGVLKVLFCLQQYTQNVRGISLETWCFLFVLGNWQDYAKGKTQSRTCFLIQPIHAETSRTPPLAHSSEPKHLRWGTKTGLRWREKKMRRKCARWVTGSCLPFPSPIYSANLLLECCHPAKHGHLPVLRVSNIHRNLLRSPTDTAISLWSLELESTASDCIDALR